MTKKSMILPIIVLYAVAVSSMYFLGARGPGLLFFFILFTVVCGAGVILVFWRVGIENRVPTYVSRVKLISKNVTENMMVPITGVECSVTFEFPDGTQKTFPIGAEALTELHEGESGTLTYKEMGSYLVFVQFERPDRGSGY